MLIARDCGQWNGNILLSHQWARNYEQDGREVWEQPLETLEKTEEKNAPCHYLFIDELDTIAPKSQGKQKIITSLNIRSSFT